jgi:hypothetical protein
VNTRTYTHIVIGRVNEDYNVMCYPETMDTSAPLFAVRNDGGKALKTHLNHRHNLMIDLMSIVSRGAFELRSTQ